MIRHIETESVVGCQGLRGGRMKSHCFMGAEFQFGKTKKFWRQMGCWFPNGMSAHVIPLNSTL